MTSETQSKARSGGHRRRADVAVSVVALVAVATLVWTVAGRGGGAAPARPPGIPAEVPAGLADLMQLSAMPARPAPAFTLTDQRGRTVSLSDFRGRAVALEFMDSHCTDICPIVSQEFVDADHDLGAAASRVAFLAVNVNPFHADVSDVAAFTQEHRLDTIPSWHFLTGAPDALPPVWSAYGVSVSAPGPDVDVVHSSFVYFIDPHGVERFIGSPAEDHRADGTAYLPGNQIAAWGAGIAAVTRSLVH